MIKVLFVCSGNVHRSAIADALFRRMVEGKEIAVDSAALCLTKVGMKPDPNIRRVVAEIGVDLAAHRSKFITRELVEEATLIVPMAEKGRRMLLELFPEAAPKVRLLNSFREDLPRDVPSPAYKTYELCFEMRENILAALPSLYECTLAAFRRSEVPL